MGKQRDNSSQRPSRPQLEELEPRILYSADALAFAPDPAVGVEIRAIDAGFADLTTTDSSRAFSGSLSAEQTVAAREIIFVDTGVDGYEELLEDLLLSLPEDTQPAIILLDTKTDGIEQISSSLAEYQNVSAVHILSHANSGEVTLGSSTLDNANLDDFANALLNWNDYLTPDADILIYGCNLAASDDGVALIDNIAALTGADVAASDDLTGNATAGGDWELEYRVGEIEALTLTASSDSTWDGTLATLTPTGESRVNSTTPATQETSGEVRGSRQAVATDSQGNHVVVWTDSNQDGSGFGVFAQRYDASGSKLGGEIAINQTTTDNQYWASVGMADNGNFTVTWTSVNQDTTASSVYARQFNADGTAAGNEFRVNTTASSNQSNATIAMNGAGQFIIAWQGNGSGDNDGIYFRLFDAAGNGGLETRANSSTSNAQTDPAVAINDNGAAAIVWDDGNDAYLTLIASDGTLSSTDTKVNPLSKTTEAAVALDNNGNSIVAFAYNGFGEDGIYYRRFDASGNDITITTVFGQPPSISSSHSSDATSPSLAMDKSSGDFIVTWQETGDGSGTAVYAKAFALNQDLIWDTERINQTTTNDQLNASVAMLDSSNYIVVWSGNGEQTGNVDNDGVFLRQFGTNTNTAPTADAGGPYSLDEGGTLTLDASASSDPDGDTLSYRWDLNGDGSYGDVTGATPSVDWATLQSFGIDDDGSYTLGVQVDDGNGGVSTTTATLTVANVAPTLSVTGATQAYAGVAYTLNLAATDPGNDNLTSWTINWGDGSIETLNGNPASATHVYANTGFTHNILVSATDEDGTYLHNDLFAGHYVNNAGVYRIQGNWGNAPSEFATEGDLDKTIQPVVGPDGQLYVTGEASNNILRYDASTGAFIDIFATLSGNDGGLAFGPDGQLYVSNYSAKTIEKIDASDGSSLGSFATGLADNPYSLTFGPDGNLYVGLYNTGTRLKLDGSTGAVLGSYSTSGSGGLATPEQLIFGPDGYLYVADLGNGNVQRFNPVDGSRIDAFIPASDPKLDQPNGLAFGADGLLYVSDALDGEILRYDSSGNFVDVYASGLDKPSLLGFAPDLQVTVSATGKTAVASDANGNFINVWETRSVTGDSWDIVAQRYDIDGNTIGSPFTVNANTAGDQTDPDVAMDANGNVVVSWSSGGDVYYRVFDSNDTPVNGSGQIANTTTAGEQAYASVAYDGLGNFLISWSSQGQDDSGDATGWGVYAQRFLADGSRKDGEFLVNTTTAGDQMYSDVSADDYGDFVIAWQGNGGSTGWDIYSKLYRDSGAVLSDERLRNTETAGDQHSVSIAMEADGDYSLAWVSEGQDGDGGGIYFDNVAWGGSGTNTSGEQRVNSTTAGDQQNVQMASDPTGNLVITWTSTGQDGDSSNETNLYHQLYWMKNSGPEAQGSETLVNTYTTHDQGHPAVTADPNGDVIFAWSGEVPGGTTGIDRRILLNALNNQTPTVSLANSALSYTENDPAMAIDPALTVADPDSTNLAKATVQIRDGFAQGEDELTFIAQSGISGSYDAATGILSFSGSATLADYETLLRSVSYRNNSDNPSTVQRVIEFTVDDGTASSSDTRKLNVAAANDAPSLDSMALDIGENSNSLTLSAFDPEGDSVTYSLTAGNDLALFSLDTNTGVLTFNTAPDYEAPGDANGDNVYELEITVSDDQGASAIQPIIVTVTNLNDNAPVLAAIENTPLGYTENDTATPITGSLALSDADNGNIASATVRITGNYQAGEDLLAYTGAGNITATWDATTGTLTLNGSDTVANYQAALRSVTYSNGSENPSVATRTVSFSVNDGVTDSNTVTRNIAVTAVNDSPSLSLNATPSVTEGGSVTLTRSQLNASDPDDSATGLTYSVTGGLANGQLELTTNPGVAINSFTQDDIDNNRVIYVHDGSQTSSDSLSFSLADGGEDGALTISGSFSIAVTGVNDAPVNTVPGAQSVNEDTPLPLTGISVADADDNLASVELTVANGTLNLTLAGSASLSAGANGSSALTLSGSLTDINSTLATLTYRGNADFNGSDTLTVRSTDTVGASDTDTVDITINPVNDAPEISASATSFSANMIGIAALDSQQITIADPDASSKPLQLTLVAESGKIHVDTGSRQVTVLSGNDAANVTLSGTLVELNALLHGADAGEGGIFWSGKLESDARQVDLQITVDDQGNSGGNAKTATQHFTIDVPASHANEPIVLDEDAEPLQLDPYLLFGVDATATQLAFSVSDIADPDLLDATISTANGRSMLTLIPLADQHGETSIKLTAQTSTGNRLETTLSVIINSIPDAPVIAIEPIEGATNNAVRVLIAPNSADGTDSDINFFYISGISGGELYYADGESKIENDSFISREEANAGLIFVPENGVATASTLRFSVLGAFNDRGLPPGAKAAEFSFDVQPPQVAQTPPPSKIELTDIPTPETLTHNDDQNIEDSAALLLRQAIKDAEEARQRGEPTTTITTPPITIQPVHTMPVSEEALDDFSVLGNDGARKTVDRASFAQLITRYLDEIERQKDVLVVTSYEHLFESLERLRDEFHELGLSDRTVIGSAVVASAGLSAGYVVWMLRGGLLISSMMFSVPAWSIADPLTILAAQRDEEDDDSLEDIARKGARKKNEKAS